MASEIVNYGAITSKANGVAGGQLNVSMTSGSPQNGPYKIGDTAYGNDGAEWVCTVAGSPGTWVQVGASINGIVIPVYEYVTLAQAAGTSAATFAATQPFYTFANDGFTWAVKAISVRFHAAGGASCTVASVTVDGTAGAPGGGTTQLASTISLTGSIDTVVNASIITTPTTIVAGNSLGVTFGGTPTGLAGFVMTVALQRLS